MVVTEIEAALPKPGQQLTDQQALFVERYLVHWNATKAAKEAKYSEKSAAKLGHDLLKNPLVRAEIEKALDDTSKDHKELRYRIIQELTGIAFSNLKNYGTFDKDGLVISNSADLDDQVAAVIAEFKVHESEGKNSYSKNVAFKLASKEKALELLMRHLGMLNDKVEVTLPKPFVLNLGADGQVVLGAEKPKKEEK